MPSTTGPSEARAEGGGDREQPPGHDLEKFFEMSLDLLCIAGTNGYFQRVNRAFERALGWTSAELLRRPFFDFVHPEEREATVREVGRLASGIPTTSFENRYQRADGTYRRLLWTAFPEPQAGLLYAVARDVTELHALQELSRQAGLILPVCAVFRSTVTGSARLTATYHQGDRFTVYDSHSDRFTVRRVTGS